MKSNNYYINHKESPQRACPASLLAHSGSPAHLLRCDDRDEISGEPRGELRGDGDRLLGVEAPEVSAEDPE